MKPSKDRLHRVIIIGATPAGIAAANKLGELGIPVALIDSDYDINQKLAKDTLKFKTGVPLNYGHRPGLIRIIRNPDIRCILPAEIVSIKHSNQGFRVRIKKLPTYVDDNSCTLCGRCVETCPVSVPEGYKAIRLTSRLSLPGRPVIDKRMQPACQASCPLGVNAQGYIALTKTGRFKEALALVRQNNVLPGICGRICTHPCEDLCRRSELDEPVAIRDIKRFLADYEIAHPEEEKPEFNDRIADKKTEKIAVAGSGPAGLAAAADLARIGYDVTIFEKEKMAGGLLRYGIGPHRLPRDILNLELGLIEKMGVKIITSQPVDLVSGMDDFRKDFDAVIVSTGTLADRKLGVPGEDIEGVEGCLAILHKIYTGVIKEFKQNVAVIGDGNAAFDLARVLSRIGARVTILSWFSEDFIPADTEEVKAALDEGITIKHSIKTVECIEHNGKLNLIRCRPTRPGEPDSSGIRWPVIIPDSESFELAFDYAVVAIGQKSVLKNNGSKEGIDVTDNGLVIVDGLMHTNLSGVYAAGDAASGQSSVVEAMASGRLAAQTVHDDFCKKNGCSSDIGKIPVRPTDRDFEKISEDIPSSARNRMPEIQPVARKGSFSEVAIGLSKSQAVFEAERCLQCGVCAECLQCVAACGAIGAINHDESSVELLEQAGVVIIADPDMVSNVKGEDVIRAYGPKTAKPDLYAMFIRGYASAAKALILLGGTSLRPRGFGLAFAPPDPGLSPTTRIGVFACRCNDSLGWLDGMSEYIEDLNSREEIAVAEVVTAACIPEGYTHIIRTIREKGITRVVLASCVCCPLNFVCSSCTDQRSRLKRALFTGSGISRSIVEMCNIRGEALSLIQEEPSFAMTKFKGMIDRSIRRARDLNLLSAPVRNYNFTTAVIGNSEASNTSALALAKAGLEVFLFRTRGEPVFETPNHPNIHCFEDYLVKCFSGTLGDFRIFVESDGFRHSMHAGAIILGERSRKSVEYIYQEGLPGRIIEYSMQKNGLIGVPFLYPGTTSIAGLFLSDPPGINTSERIKGSAAAVQAAAIMPLGPRQSKGYTVVVNEDLCRGCGRCISLCPYQAISLKKNSMNGWFAFVDEAMCKGCGNCISVCPTNAADSPYRDQIFLEHMLKELLQK